MLSSFSSALIFKATSYISRSSGGLVTKMCIELKLRYKQTLNHVNYNIKTHGSVVQSSCMLFSALYGTKTNEQILIKITSDMVLLATFSSTQIRDQLSGSRDILYASFIW